MTGLILTSRIQWKPVVVQVLAAAPLSSAVPALAATGAALTGAELAEDDGGGEEQPAIEKSSMTPQAISGRDIVLLLLDSERFQTLYH